MDFQLTADQAEIKAATRKLCAGRCPIDSLRAREGRGLDRDVWAELAGAGFFSLTTEGFGRAEAALVFVELGRGLVPGPLVWTHIGATLGIEAGRVVGGIVAGSGPGSGGRLADGAPVVIDHFDDLDDLLVVERDRVMRIDPRRVDGRPLEPLDPLTPVSVADELPEGDAVGGAAEAARVRLEGAALVAAQLAGMASALVELTVAYTADRRQFGRPVGSFQALKHLMADMLTRAELARTQAYAAAAWLDDPALGPADRAVSAAKVVAGDAAIRNGRDSIQAHGGMGYTWEVDSHLYLKRAWVLDPLFGSADDHAEAMAGNLR